jgi:hypothetical protein
MFLYNGLERLGSKAPGPASSRALDPPGLLRLLHAGVSQNAMRIGLTTLAAVLLGILAATLAAGRRPRGVALSPPARLAVAIGVWLACGLILFSAIPHLQARYLEVLAPAVSATLGIAIGSLLARRRIELTLATAAIALPLLGTQLATDVGLIHTKRSDSVLHDPISVAMGRYLRTHRGLARYELAGPAVFDLTGLVARDGLPILVLNDVDGSLVPTETLLSLIQTGQLRFYFATHGCHTGPYCPADERWAYLHSEPVVGYPGLRRFAIVEQANRRPRADAV